MYHLRYFLFFFFFFFFIYVVDPVLVCIVLLVHCLCLYFLPLLLVGVVLKDVI